MFHMSKPPQSILLNYHTNRFFLSNFFQSKPTHPSISSVLIAMITGVLNVVDIWANSDFYCLWASKQVPARTGKAKVDMTEMSVD